MKKLLILFCCALFLSCDSENGSDCFKTAGTISTQEFDLNTFNRIVVTGNLSLVIKQGDQQRVTVRTGENLFNKVSLKVEDSTLTASYVEGCNFVRDYDLTQIIITAPEINYIRNASSQTVVSEGMLNYPNLDLESFTRADDGDNFYNISGFDLRCDNERIGLLANGKGLFRFSGKTGLLSVRFSDGQPRFEGEALEAQNVSVFTRSANKIIINPIQSLNGEILGTGDVIAINRPPEVEVSQQYTGKLIFNAN